MHVPETYESRILGINGKQLQTLIKSFSKTFTFFLKADWDQLLKLLVCSLFHVAAAENIQAFLPNSVQTLGTINKWYHLNAVEIGQFEIKFTQKDRRETTQE